MTNQARTIYLKFSDESRGPVRARLTYAFRVFAAIYNYRVVEADASDDAICLVYGGNGKEEQKAGCLRVPERYDENSTWAQQENLVRHHYAGEDFPLFYGIDAATGNPDWLGEIFEWISSSHESCITSRDSIGRIAYDHMLFSKQGISPRKPYATLLMAWMENALRNGNTKETLPRAESPIPGASHALVCSQDIDFYYVDKASLFVRLVKNLGISALQARNLSFFRSSLLLFGKALAGERVGDYLPAMLKQMEDRGIQSTLFVVARKGHRRDPNYNLEQIAPHLLKAPQSGFPVELHGSYTSVMEGATLTDELSALQKATGQTARGNRQHWLRFSDHGKLFRAVEEAKLAFDSTLGFSEMVGFRNGASFAYPPYDFERERPYSFLEIPLAVMDVSLEAAALALKANPQELAEEVLQQSRKYGWGGISLLWHNPVEPLHVPEEINEVFWNCARKKEQSNERWMSGREFVAQCLGRYQNAGLLQEVRTPS